MERKLTKTLDVTGVPDNLIANFESVCRLGPDKIDLILSGRTAIESLEQQRDEMKRVVKIVIDRLSQPEDFSRPRLENWEMASALRKVLTDKGITL